MTGISDSFERPINYLRISVTDRCNLRCIYCMRPGGVDLIPRHNILSYEEIYTIVKAATELGITKIRLTGGEPLVREGLPQLIRMLARIDRLDDISLTTNGTLLGHYAAQLKAAVDAYLVDSGPTAAIAEMCGWPVGSWCTSQVQDFSRLFSAERIPSAASFDEYIGDWVTRNAINVTAMFEGASSFNQSLTTWNVSSVIMMRAMFQDAKVFQSDVSA